MATLAADWGTGEVFWSLLWFFLFVIWIWLLIGVFSDIFRSHDLSGVAKALWTIGIIVFPYVGVFLYLVLRGRKMSEHALELQRQREEGFRAYVRDAAGAGSGASTADELQKLGRLRDEGVLDDAEYARAKAKALA